SPTGGILLSSNAPPLDALRVTNERPARLPWLFGLVGPVKATAVLADLGPHQHYPHSKLFVYKVSALPHPRFEVGAQVMDEMGGAGSPPRDFVDRVLDAVPLLDALAFHPTSRGSEVAN